MLRGLSGSSPRGRGTRYDAAGNLTGERFIPARAGNAVMLVSTQRPSPVHPRAGGERADSALNADDEVGSSPRGRGTR